MASEEEREAKKPKVDEAKPDDAATNVETKAAEVKETFQEEADAVADKRLQIKEEVCVHPSDSTLNVINSLGGRILMPFTDGGLQYLIAGARGSVGVKAGRYCYEVKIIEALNPSEPPNAKGSGRGPTPRSILRLGYSLQNTSLLLGEEEGCICFDSEGFFNAGRTRSPYNQRLGREQAICVVLNLDPKSRHANTVSLFREGERVSQPQPIPESMLGKPLFPHICFRNVTLQVNWGPTLIAALPFTCRMIQSAAKEDVYVSPIPASKDGKYEVLFPVGLPDEGVFDWIDSFLEKNPQYTELSDRIIVDWAVKSGLWRPKTQNWKNSNDKPEMNFGLPLMDDYSVQRIMRSVISTQPRNYIVMEVKSNLMKNERMDGLSRFRAPLYKKVAMVVMGEPTADFKDKAHQVLLNAKQEKLETEWKQRQLEKSRKKEIAKQQKMIEAKKAAEAAEREAAEKAAADEKAAAEEKKEDVKKEEEVKKEESVDVKKEEGDDVKKEDVKSEEVVGEQPSDVKKEGDDAKKEDAADAKKEETTKMDVDEGSKAENKEGEQATAAKPEPMAEEEEEQEPAPVATLTDEEKRQWFLAKSTNDLAPWVLSSSFTHFSLPDKEEGFDEVRFPWQKAGDCKEYLHRWVLKRKITTRLEEIQPGEWFKDKLAGWHKVLQQWHAKHTEWNDPLRQAQRQVAEQAPPKAPLEPGLQDEKPAEEAKKETEPAATDDKPQEGDSADKAGGEDEKKMDAAPDEASKTEEPPESSTPSKPPTLDELDIFSVKDVCDIGGGMPIFAKFEFEDWALLSLRFELWLLVHAFKRDAGDPERVGIHETHLSFYYNKYYRKSFNVKHYGVNTTNDLVELVKDTINLHSEDTYLEAQLDVETETDLFMKLTEEGRCNRQRSIDAGDETAKLQFVRPAPAVPPQGSLPPKGSEKGSRNYHGGGKGRKSYGKDYGGNPPGGYGPQYHQAPPHHGGKGGRDKGVRDTYGKGGGPYGAPPGGAPYGGGGGYGPPPMGGNKGYGKRGYEQSHGYGYKGRR